jgi:hypothetical protein
VGIKRDKSYSAKDVKAALVNLGYNVLKCEPSGKNFLVQVSGQGAQNQGISCGLDGQKCKAGGLTGQHGITGLSQSKLEAQ